MSTGQRIGADRRAASGVLGAGGLPSPAGSRGASHSQRRVGRYLLPQAAESEEGYAALTNADLPGMSRWELRRELTRVQVALALGTDRQLGAVRADYPHTWTARSYFTARKAEIMAQLKRGA